MVGCCPVDLAYSCKHGRRDRLSGETENSTFVLLVNTYTNAARNTSITMGIAAMLGAAFAEIVMYDFYDWELYQVCSTVIVVACVLIMLRSYGAWRRAEGSRLLRLCEASRSEHALRVLAASLQDDVLVGEEEINEISELQTEELIRQITEGSLLASDVVSAFQTLALCAHAQHSCIATNIEEASQWGSDRDLSENEDERKGSMLFGLPISLSEGIPMKEYVSGMTPSSHNSRVNSPLVKLLKRQGAVPFMRTKTQHPDHVSTTNAMTEPRAFIPGLPRDACLGEAILQASGGSCLGFGLDLVGGLRLSAAVAGVCCFRWTSGRVGSQSPGPSCASNDGGVTSPQLPYPWGASCGPISHRMSSITLACRALFHPKMADLDCSIPPMVFREDVFRSARRLNIGYYISDGIYQADRDQTHAVMATKEWLQGSGHTLLPWQPPPMGFLRSPPREGTSSGTYVGQLWSCVRCILKQLDPRVTKYHPDGDLGIGISIRSVDDWLAVEIILAAYRRKVARQWKKLDLDAVICPVLSQRGGKNDARSGCDSTGFTMPYSVLDYPSGVVTIDTEKLSRVNASYLSEPPDIAVMSSTAGTMGDNGGYGRCHSSPVQVVTKRWQDELCLRLMKEIESHCGKH